MRVRAQQIKASCSFLISCIRRLHAFVSGHMILNCAKLELDISPHLCGCIVWLDCFVVLLAGNLCFSFASVRVCVGVHAGILVCASCGAVLLNLFFCRKKMQMNTCVWMWTFS